MKIAGGMSMGTLAKAPNTTFATPYKKQQKARKGIRVRVNFKPNVNCPPNKRGGVHFQTRTGGSMSLPKQLLMRESRVVALGGTKTIPVRRAALDKYGLLDYQTRKSALAKRQIAGLRQRLAKLEKVTPRGEGEERVIMYLKRRIKDISLSAYSAAVPVATPPGPPPTNASFSAPLAMNVDPVEEQTMSSEEMARIMADFKEPEEGRYGGPSDVGGGGGPERTMSEPDLSNFGPLKENKKSRPQATSWIGGWLSGWGTDDESDHGKPLLETLEKQEAARSPSSSSPMRSPKFTGKLSAKKKKQRKEILQMAADRGWGREQANSRLIEQGFRSAMFSEQEIADAKKRKGKEKE